jgi:lipopolysaccharide export system protein LptA
MNRSATRHFAILALVACGIGWACNASALPEDKLKPILIDNPDGDATMSGEDVTLRGTADKPAKVTQGTMEISGIEIHIDRQNGAVQSITASGNPARFQQQPAADQAIVHVSGQNMTLDNTSQTVAVDTGAEYSHGGNSMSAAHLDYNMETGAAGAKGGVQMIVQPQNAQETSPP